MFRNRSSDESEKITCQGKQLAAANRWCCGNWIYEHATSRRLVRNIVDLEPLVYEDAYQPALDQPAAFVVGNLFMFWYPTGLIGE